MKKQIQEIALELNCSIEKLNQIIEIEYGGEHADNKKKSSIEDVMNDFPNYTEIGMILNTAENPYRAVLNVMSKTIDWLNNNSIFDWEIIYSGNLKNLTPDNWGLAVNGNIIAYPFSQNNEFEIYLVPNQDVFTLSITMEENENFEIVSPSKFFNMIINQQWM